MNENLSNQVLSLWRLTKKYLTLQFDYAKLTLAEKLTILFSAIVILLICFILASFALGFISFAAIDLLKTIMPTHIAYLIMAGIFILITIIIFSLRKSLIINPISRFISKLFFDKKL